MRQHAEAKRAHPDAIVFFRLGDFYEMFGDDAVACSELLDLTLTSRNRGKPDEVPMAGVPHHAAHGYIGRLLALGRKVAICEQMADPATTRGIVPREVVRVITPGTITHHEHLAAGENNWLAGICREGCDVALALYDMSTGELRAGVVDNLASALSELCRSAPREVLVVDEEGEETLTAVKQTLGGALVSRWEAGDAQQSPVDVPSAEWLEPSARRALDVVLQFAQQCNPGRKLTPTRIGRWRPGDSLLLDPSAQAHLELVTSASGDRELTLLHCIDLTQSAGGARLLRRRLLAPLTDPASIDARLDQVEVLAEDGTLREALRQGLARVTDIERIATRAQLGEATPRDLGRLRDGLAAARECIRVLLANQGYSQQVLHVHELTPALAELLEELDRALVEAPPAVAKEGAVFKAEYDSQLAELSELREQGTQATSALQDKLRAELDIPSLKVRYTRVFGWYVEVSRNHTRRVPDTFRRKQTVASGERYTLTELDELAERIRTAEEDHRLRELALLDTLVQHVHRCVPALCELAAQLSEWDCSAALAEVAARHDYVRPQVDTGLVLDIEAGRHPVVERWAASGRFVPNDTRLDAKGCRLWLLTGPNMAGKSTLLRQTALITILAQMGSFVPARKAHVGVADRVLSRVGASDNLARGESTFMVEMRETAEILRSATDRSLVILDEIGRGTSTFDGLSIAWAVAEHLCAAVRCRGLFATHYHELTQLASTDEGIANYSVSAREIDGDVVFLHTLTPGPASRSYGVAVARLAGLPSQVLARAEQLLEELEGGAKRPPEVVPASAAKDTQMSLFMDQPQHEQEVLEQLRSTDPNRLTPLKALRLLAQLRERLLGRSL